MDHGVLRGVVIKLCKGREALKKSTKIRIAVSVGMIVLAVVLGILLDGTLTGEHTSMWQRMVFIISVVGTGLAGFLGLFMGTPGYLLGYGAVLFLTLPSALPDPWDGYFIVACFGALFIWLAVNKGKENKDTPPEEALPEELLEEMTEEERQSMEKFSSLIIVDQPTTGRMYQLISSGRELLAYRVGGELKGVNTDLLQLEGEPLRPLGEKDFAIDTADIRSVRLTELHRGWMSSMAVIKTRSKNYRFNALESISAEDYAAFWRSVVPGGVQVLEKNPIFEEEPAEDHPMPDEKRTKILRTVLTCSGVYLAVVNLTWLFLDVPYRLFSALSIIALPLLLTLYFCFPNELTVVEKAKKSRKISLNFQIVMAGIVPALRTMLDFDFTNGWRVFFVSAGFFVVMLALLLVLSKEWKKNKFSVLALMLFVLLYYSYSAAGQLNHLLDFAPPQVTDGYLAEMRSTDDNDYYLTVLLPDGEELKLRTSQEHYESLSTGETVSVYLCEGGFGMHYAFAD